MRTLRFIIDGQTIKPDPKCDFSGLVPGTSGYLQAEFSFSSEWNGTTRVAGFYSNMGREYEPQVLNKGTVCVIPPEALTNRIFKIRVIGKKNDFKIMTNKLAVQQEGGSL